MIMTTESHAAFVDDMHNILAELEEAVDNNAPADYLKEIIMNGYAAIGEQLYSATAGGIE